MKQSLQLRLGQQLTMTPQLQQAIRLLQLSVLDLRGEMQEAVESNPMLELEEGDHESESSGETSSESSSVEQSAEVPESTRTAETEIHADNEQMPDELPVDADWDAVYEAPPARTRDGGGSGGQDGESDYLAHRSKELNLQDHLEWQLNLTRLCDSDRVIAQALLDAIDDDGYLSMELDDIRLGLQRGGSEVDLEDMEAVLGRVQQFDPPGVGARDLQECLILQLRQLAESSSVRDSALSLLEDHFPLLAEQNHAQIKRRLKLTDDELTEVMLLIRSLVPKPGVQVVTATPEYIVPDVVVSRRSGKWHVELNPEAVPRLRINTSYASLVRRADQSSDNTFLRNNLQEARWLLKSLHSRNETLLRVATTIVELQRAFFDYGEEAMKPLVLRDVAERLEMHESTISRVTTNKYMHTPRGTFEFKYFFSSHVSTAGGGECSATAIRALIKKLVAAENPRKPLSDSKLATILDGQGIQVARRTVAKYRESLSIPPSNERKRLM
jgi:RNA polymerase sigma-54 factor